MLRYYLVGQNYVFDYAWKENHMKVPNGLDMASRIYLREKGSLNAQISLEIFLQSLCYHQRVSFFFFFFACMITVSSFLNSCNLDL